MRWMPMDKRDACGNAYDTQWREARKLYLQRHPLCVKCLEDKKTPATVVDGQHTPGAPRTPMMMPIFKMSCFLFMREP